MHTAKISHIFTSLVAPSHPNEWEIDEITESLSPLSDENCSALLNSVPSIWPVSHTLCYSYLRLGAKHIQDITIPLLPEWVRQLLFFYERGGLRDAESFMADVKTNFLDKIQSDSQVNLLHITGRLTHFIRGVSNTNLSIAEDSQVWTDTDRIYLPESINLFPDKESNRLFYTLLTTYQWSIIRLNLFNVISRRPDQQHHDEKAEKIRTLISTDQHHLNLFRYFLFLKTSSFLQQFLPGLWKRCKVFLYAELVEGLVSKYSSSASITRYIKTHTLKEPTGKTIHLIDQDEILIFFEQFKDITLPTFPEHIDKLLGVLKFDRAEERIQERRRADKAAFTMMLAKAISDANKNYHQTNETDEKKNIPSQQREEALLAMLSAKLNTRLHEGKKELLKIDNQNVMIPDELVELANSIQSDLGFIPDGYVQAAAGIAGGALLTTTGPEQNADEKGIGYTYDEWDCRRAGYRKDWCTVVEEELPISKSNFIEQTLTKYSGLRKRLQNQFEMMRTSYRFIRRQRDGDDIDLDAITDAIGDKAAGKSFNDRLFIRLQRDERNIATLFMVDMSNSTSGWIGAFIKESLVLLCEAMEMVGDRYGIYGFSGMRRSRCKLYHIKHLHEHYSATIRDRIAAIGPKDYTRMAPVIRHLTSLLEQTDAKTRLLFSLSDGKPEDYDGYNGEYAIEDTKKALLEARGKGITPFCVTIDKQAHDYLDHMYGSGNYIFINKIQNLPARMPQIYRTLAK